MVRGWKLKLINPKDAVVKAVNEGWAFALKDIEDWMESDLTNALINGGFGIQGIRDTAFYNFITSPDGLSQLGIEKGDAHKLLEAYRKSIKVSRNNRLVTLKFGDHARLRLSTPHPYAGIKHLHVQSWMEFVLDGVKAQSGFVPRAKLPESSQKHIRVKSAPGGLMLPQGKSGSSGSWQFPAKLLNYDSDWLKRNAAKIEKAIQQAAIRFLTKRVS